MPHVSAIIPAAGAGKRMGGSTNKQYLSIGSNPVIIEALLPFENSPLINEIILVSPADSINYVREIVDRFNISKVTKIVEGGKERQDSIKNGLDSLDGATDIVVVHDGVRPFIEREVLEETIREAGKYGAAIAAVPVKDTVKEVDEGVISRTVPRQALWLAQTPQTFRYELIRAAYDHAEESGLRATDDASLVEAMGKEVRIVMGSYDNIKITTPEDLVFAEAIIKERSR